MLTRWTFVDLRRLALVALFTAGGTAPLVRADDLAGRPFDPASVTQAPAVPSPTPLIAEPVEAKALERRTLGRFFPNVGRSFIGVFSKPSVAPLIIGGSLAGFGSLLDDDIHESAAKDSLGDAGDTLGGPVVSLSVATALFIGGRFANEGRFRAMTYDLGVGTLVNAGYTEIIKVAVGRERPDQSDNKSFPSGHTSHSFMVATIARKHYGWKLGAPMYAIAGFIGYSRLNKDKHWFSDVLAGATLGYISGITVVRQDDKPVPARRTVMVSPILGPHQQRGLQLAITFR
jgi:membrane-associated phospholipid phosphatase